VKGAIWQRQLDHLKPELARATGRSESHPEFQALFNGLVKVTHSYDMRSEGASPIGHLRETLSRAINTTSKLQQLLSSIKTNEAEAIDEQYSLAFNEYAKKDLDQIDFSYEQQRSKASMRLYLMELRDCDEGRAGINIMLDNLLRALELQEMALPLSAKGKNRDIHPFKGELLELARIIDGLGWAVSIKKSSVYFRYCSFFLAQVTDSGTIDPTRQIAEAIKEFKLIAVDKNAID
jgi:hypothetical protein